MDTQWEYTTLSMSSSLDVTKDLNQLGKENWEVVAAGTTSGNGCPNELILKRPKRARKRDDDYGYGR